MKQRILCGNSGQWGPGIYLLVAVFSILCVSSAKTYAQTPDRNTHRASYIKKEISSQTAGPGPFLKEYRKITIGMPADTLRDVWGKPTMEYSDGFLYEMSESETIQIAIGPEKNVTTIAVTFEEGKGAPAFAEILGEGVVPEKREDGSVYKLVRYPDAGYWVAYYAGPTENANVSVTMQKL